MGAQHEGDEREGGSSGRRWWLIVLVAILVAVWYSGTFDRALVNVGLNSRPCGTNGFGATFCGKDRERYEHEVAEPTRDALDEFDRRMREQVLQDQADEIAAEHEEFCAYAPTDSSC